MWLKCAFLWLVAWYGCAVWLMMKAESRLNDTEKATVKTEQRRNITALVISLSILGAAAYIRPVSLWVVLPIIAVSAAYYASVNLPRDSENLKRYAKARSVANVVYAISVVGFSAFLGAHVQFAL